MIRKVLKKHGLKAIQPRSAGRIFYKLLEKSQVTQRMSRADNPYDNAFMESYFSPFKAELLEAGAFERLEDAQTEILENIQMYYNPLRRHSTLGYISPVTFEKSGTRFS